MSLCLSPTGKDEGNGVKLTFIAVGIQKAGELWREEV